MSETAKVSEGTRCECRNPECVAAARFSTSIGRHHVESQSGGCCRKAVRLVAMPFIIRYESGNDLGQRHTPMCEPCAQYHEAKETVK